MKRKTAFLLSLLLIFTIFTGCGKQEKDSNTIIFLNDLSGMQDKLGEYAREFEDRYPQYTVEIQTVSKDYDDICRARVGGESAGDVMVLSKYMKTYSYEKYYEPIGTVDELKEKYRYIESDSADNNVYALPLTASVSGGMIYDKSILDKAGVAKIPENFEELADALKKVKENTDAVPIYSNLREEQKSAYWNSFAETTTGKTDYNSQFLENKNIFDDGSLYKDIYQYIYDFAKNGYFEKDFYNSLWNKGLTYFEEKSICAAAGSIQMYEEAKKVNSDLIFMPFKAEDGKYYLKASPERTIGILKNSNNKEGAKLWIDFLYNETDFLETTGSEKSVLVKNPEPDYAEITGISDITVLTESADNSADARKFDEIDDESTVALQRGNAAFECVDNGYTGNKTYEEIINKFNENWAEGRADVEKYS